MTAKIRETQETVYVKLPSRVLDALDHHCVDLRIKRPEALRRAVEGWLSGFQDNEPARKLAVILGSGDVPTIEAVKQNIDVFFDRLKPRREDESR